MSCTEAVSRGGLSRKTQLSRLKLQTRCDVHRLLRRRREEGGRDLHGGHDLCRALKHGVVGEPFEGQQEAWVTETLCVASHSVLQASHSYRF